MADYTIFHPVGHTAGLNMDAIGFGIMSSMTVVTRSSTGFVTTLPVPFGYPNNVLSDVNISGVGLGYSALGNLLIGNVTGFSITNYAPGGFLQQVQVTGITNAGGDVLGAALTSNDNTGAITGGAGADLFHDSQDAGVDRVLDFHLSEGDKVMLDPGTTFTVSQSGADTLIDMGSGNQMILVGVQMSSLPPGTIFLG